MLSSRPRSWVSFAIVAGLLLSTAACQRDDSFLLVEVAGDLTLAPAQLRATVGVGLRSSTFLVPPEPTVISLPTSFTVELDRSITGPVTVIVDALDAYGLVLAQGETSQAHINPGGHTIVVVTLGAPP